MVAVLSVTQEILAIAATIATHAQNFLSYITTSGYISGAVGEEVNAANREREETAAITAKARETQMSLVARLCAEDVKVADITPPAGFSPTANS